MEVIQYNGMWTEPAYTLTSYRLNALCCFTPLAFDFSNNQFTLESKLKGKLKHIAKHNMNLVQIFPKLKLNLQF